MNRKLINNLSLQNLNVEIFVCICIFCINRNGIAKKLTNFSSVCVIDEEKKRHNYDNRKYTWKKAKVSTDITNTDSLNTFQNLEVEDHTVQENAGDDIEDTLQEIEGLLPKVANEMRKNGFLQYLIWFFQLVSLVYRRTDMP